MKASGRLHKGCRSRQGASKPSPAAAARPTPAFQHSRRQGVRAHSNTAAKATSSRDERSTARQTAEAANSILVDGVVVQPAYRSTPWEAEAKHAATATDKVRVVVDAAAVCTTPSGTRAVFSDSNKPQEAVVMFVSESGICRGPLAAAAFSQLLQHSPLRECLQVTFRATRDYCQGEPADPTAAAAAEQLGFSLHAKERPSTPSPTTNSSSSGSGSSGQQQQQQQPAAGSVGGGVAVFNPLEDIVAADIVLVMDKYTAADVLREVSSYDLINPGGRYSSRVRLLGSFHPQLASQTQTPDGQDIDDALYGNEGGQEEQADVLSAAKVIVESCRNLLQYFEDLAISNGLPINSSSSSNGSRSSSDSQAAAAAAPATVVEAENGSSGSGGGNESLAARFKAVLVQHVQDEGVIEWLVPPMLQGSNVDLDGWI